MSGDISAPSTNFTIDGFPPLTSLKEVRYVPIKIYAKLTEEDIKEMNKYINNFFGRRLPFFQALNRIDQKLSIENQKENRSKTYETRRGLKELREKRFGKDW